MVATRLTAVIHGEVQGAGFREKIREAAVAQGLVGRVKNLGDGTVSLILEGRRDVLEAFALALGKGDSVVKAETVDMVWSEATGEFTTMTNVELTFEQEMLLASKSAVKLLTRSLASQQSMEGKLDGINGTLGSMDGKLDGIGGTLTKMDGKFDGIGKKVDATNTTLGTTNKTLGRMERTLGRMEKKIDTTNTTLGRIGKKVDTTNRVAKGTNLALTGMSKKLGRRFDSVDTQLAALPASLNRTVRVAVEDAVIAHDARRWDPGPSAGRPGSVSP